MLGLTIGPTGQSKGLRLALGVQDADGRAAWYAAYDKTIDQCHPTRVLMEPFLTSFGAGWA
jgi:hypothetical protein